MFFELLFSAIFFFLVATLAEVITVPLDMVSLISKGQLGLQLDAEGGVQPHAGPVVKSYFAMMKRVRVLEGWKGLYKGLMPSIISTFVVTVFTWIFIGSSMPRGADRYSAPSATPLQLLIYTVFVTLIGLPLTILTNRAITTPYLLSWSDPRHALRRLFTPTELRKPWILYFTPGLLGAKILHLCYIILILRSFRSWLLPSVDAIAGGRIERGSGVPPDFTGLRIGTYFLLAALSTVVLCPLEVLATRLSLQRNHPSTAAFEAVAQEEGAEPEEHYAGTEDVIGLRSEFDPYVGFTDAAKRMVDEEGWKALYRGWWVTLLASMLSAFA